MLDQIKLFLDLYNGAYGRTLHIEFKNLEEIRSLRDTFVSLSQRKISTAIVSQGDETRLGNCRSIILHVEKTPTVEIKACEAGAQVIWRQPSGEWDNCAGLMEGMEKKGPGHQYLQPEASPIIIEVSYGER